MGIRNSQGKGWQAQNPEHRHPMLIKFMAKFLQKYAILYFEKLLIAGNKTVRDLPKYWGNLHGKRYMCMHHILEKCRNPNSPFYHAQAKELDAQYAANLCTVMAPDIYYIFRHRAADIKMPSQLGRKLKMEN